MRTAVTSLLVLTALTVMTAIAQENAFVSVKGQDIVTPDGKPLLLRGINTGNWLVPEGYMFKFDSATSPRMINEVFSELVGGEEARLFWRKYRDAYITHDDIKYIRELGLNSVRVPFNWRLFTVDEHPDVWAGPGFEMLDRIIGWCRTEGIWVILDMHCAPGGQTGDNIDDSYGYPFLFESPESQERAIQLWKKIADRYRNERIVIGYDLLNEPIAHYYDQKKLNPALEPFYKRVVAAIREVDPNHLVILGGAQWDTNFGAFGPPFDAKAVYTFHKYWCDTTQAMIQEYVDFRAKYNVPIWMGESGENKNAWIDAWRRLMERNNIGWCFWPYKKMDAPSCVVTFPLPADWSLIKHYAAGPRATYKDIRESRPPVEKVRAAMDEFLRMCLFKNCKPNPGYLKALGVAQ